MPPDGAKKIIEKFAKMTELLTFTILTHRPQADGILV